MCDHALIQKRMGPVHHAACSIRPNKDVTAQICLSGADSLIWFAYSVCVQKGLQWEIADLSEMTQK